MSQRRATSNYCRDFGTPVLAVCGYSGSGKTTLLERAIPELVSRGLSIAVVKHDAHGVIVDTPGKDSDRLFRAGATVALRGPDQQFYRRGPTSTLSLQATLACLSSDHDLLLVEGHKDTPLQKVWLEDAAFNSAPEGVTNVISNLAWNSDRLESFLTYLDQWIHHAWVNRSLCRAILIGDKNPRMGFIGIVASALSADSLPGQKFLLGTGTVPLSLAGYISLPDIQGIEGPSAGLLAAHRWAPHSSWIVAASDHPWITSRHIEWLVSFRRPGTWAVVSRQTGGYPHPTLAVYEPQALSMLEREALEASSANVSMTSLLSHPRTLIVDPPPDLAKALDNKSTRQELYVGII